MWNSLKCLCLCIYTVGIYTNVHNNNARQAPRERRPRSALRVVSALWQRLVRMLLAAPPCRRRDSASCRHVHSQRRPALCAAFVGTFNSRTCPQGYSQVTTEAACQSLAAIGGKAYVGSVTVESLPPGCFWLTVGGGVYLNTHATGAAHANAQQLCAGAPPSHAQPRALMRRHGGPVSTREYLTSSAELCARNAGAMKNIALYRPCIYKHVYTYIHTNIYIHAHTHI